MSPAAELAAVIEALGIGMWCRGAGHELVHDEVEVARRALAGELAGPHRDAATILLATAQAAILTAVAALRARGLAIDAATEADLVALAPAVVTDSEIALGSDDDDDDADLDPLIDHDEDCREDDPRDAPGGRLEEDDDSHA